MEAEQITADEMGSESGQAEHGLWCAALASLVDDARAYWRGKGLGGLSAESTTLEAAFDDVCRAGPMLRRLCAMTGHESEWISKGFIQWCERNMA